MKSVRYPSESVDELSALLDARREEHSSVLSRDELAALLDVVFFSSMHEEEGAHVVYDAVVLSREQARRAGLEAFEFAQTIACEPRRLAKLAPATVVDRTAIAIERTERAMVVWGIVEQKPEQPLLSLRVRAPAVLSVELGGDTVFRYSRGASTISAQGEAPAILVHVRREFAAVGALAMLADKITEKQHGGALFVWTRPIADPALGFDELRYRTSGTASSLVTRSLAGSQREREEAATIVASLACVDGAVLLSHALDVLAFGAFVRTPPRDALTPLIDPWERPQPTSAMKGARHKSALWFCQNAPHTLALVVSQDSDVSIYLRRGDSVMVQRDLPVNALSSRIGRR
ncbi:MAG: hypothetical protein U0269_20095 [Polyangiales bacterium]